MPKQRSKLGSGQAATALPGANKVWKTLADGRVARHWYAWRGRGAPLIARFEGATRAQVIAQERSVAGAKLMAEGYARAAHPTSDTGTLAGILDAWEASHHFLSRSESTKKNERGPLKAIRKSKLGSLPTRALAATGTKAIIRSWLADVAKEHPRAADTRKDILSKALNWAISESLCTVNPVVGIRDFAFADRSDIIWLPEDVEDFEKAAREARRKLFKKGTSEPEGQPAVVCALRLACWTGLRRDDLINLTWTDVGPKAITVRPRKSERRRKTAGKKAPAVVVIPRTPELNLLLVQLKPKEGDQRPWVLTNSYGKRWTQEGLTSSFRKIRDAARDKAGIVHQPAPGSNEPPIPKTLHDARGTFVTNMRMLGYTTEQVAEMVGWETADVERVAKRYADAERIADAFLKQLERRGDQS